ncbi:hypothetical protein XH90_15375 [Bradyrhizobium sp. CCBAU 53338]|nr:hypothetical protein XH90_15375 [Bradyrhizobium sp. CCBAU 53338]
MGARADEEVVYGMEHLAVAESRLGHRHGLAVALVGCDLRQQLCEVGRFEGKQDAVVARRIRVEPDQRMVVEIFHGVGDDAVLAQRDHDVIGREDEIGQEAALDDLVTPPLLQHLKRRVSLRMIDLVLVFIVREVGAEVLDIEARLRRRQVTRDQVLQPGLARHQHDLAVIGGGH